MNDLRSRIKDFSLVVFLASVPCLIYALSTETLGHLEVALFAFLLFIGFTLLLIISPTPLLGKGKAFLSMALITFFATLSNLYVWFGFQAETFKDEHAWYYVGALIAGALLTVWYIDFTRKYRNWKK